MINVYEDTYFNQHNEVTFDEIWEDEEKDSYEVFKEKYDYYVPLIKSNCILEEEYIRRTFYILFAKYGNSKTTDYGYDGAQWLLRLFSIMVEKGEVWQIKAKLQDEIRALDIDSEDVLASDTIIANLALNDNRAPGTGKLDKLPYKNQQSVNIKERGKLEAYSTYWSMLKDDINTKYIDSFKDLFSKSAINDVYNYTYVSGEVK